MIYLAGRADSLDFDGKDIRFDLLLDRLRL